MGAVKVDLSQKERSLDAKYPALDSPANLRILLSDYHALINRQYQGDYDAVVLLGFIQGGRNGGAYRTAIRSAPPGLRGGLDAGRGGAGDGDWAPSCRIPRRGCDRSHIGSLLFLVTSRRGVRN
jgi:hypothetical protein